MCAVADRKSMSKSSIEIEYHSINILVIYIVFDTICVVSQSKMVTTIKVERIFTESPKSIYRVLLIIILMYLCVELYCNYNQLD